ncbi:MAG: universal stress protein [Bacteroidetes bacterium]|nr:universal stress protein [Bacteroidota bacterium]
MNIVENGSILIPIDFSKQSLSAIKQSYNLAKHTKSKLLLMHGYTHDVDEDKAKLEALGKSTAAESGLDVSVVSVKGDIYEETSKMSEKIKSTLIVAGLDTHVRFRSFMGKSSTSKFIKNAGCPVLTVRTNEIKDNIKNIVLPFDLTPQSREKVPIVIQLAQYFKADIRIVSVFDPSDTHYENKLLPYLQQVKKYIKDKHVNTTNKSIPAKHVPETIVDYANKNNCDLIVQMNKTDVSFGEMFSGTASQHLVDISNIPVLTVNPMRRESMPLSY